MKRIIIIIIILFPSLIYGNFYSEIWSGMQLNHPTASSVASAVGRLRFGSIFNTKNPDILFHARCGYAYGKAYYGSTGLMTPANDVAIDPQELYLDSAYFLFHGKALTFTVGLIDPFDTIDGYSGFFTDFLIGDENTGFFSTHMLRLLANNGVDNFRHSSIPACFFFIQVHKYVRIKTGLTFGMATKHLFLRNTMPVEIEFKTRTSHLSLNAGFADADASGTHSISPSYGIIFEKNIFYGISIFGKYSLVDKDIKTFRTPKGPILDKHSVAKKFSPNIYHICAGLVQQIDYFGWGLGYSKLEQFNKENPEQLIELFIRTKIFDIFDFSPDFQYIFNPNGSSKHKYMWIAGLRLFYRFNFLNYDN